MNNKLTEIRQSSWTKTTLGDVLPIKYGKARTHQHGHPQVDAPVYGSSGIIGTFDRALTNGPALIIGRKGTVGSVYYSSEPCWPIDTVYFTEETSEQSFIFFKYLLEHLQLGKLDRSTAVPGLSRDDYNVKQVSIPSLAEQRQIVVEIEKQFTRLDAGVAALRRVQANLKRYRAAILKAACEDTINKPNNQKGWEKLSVGSIAEFIDPQPSHRTPPEFANGIPYIGLGDVNSNGEINFEGARKVGKDVLHEHRQRYQLQPGDFILGKIGTLGKPVKLPLDHEYALSANVVLVQANAHRVSPQFLYIFMSSPIVEALLRQGSRATTQAAFGIKKFREMAMTLPSLPEQKDIVDKTERRVSIIAALEAVTSANLQRADRLRQAILKQAFEGKLIQEALLE